MLLRFYSVGALEIMVSDSPGQVLTKQTYQNWERVIKAYAPGLRGRELTEQLKAFPLMRAAFEQGFTRDGVPRCLLPLSPWCKGEAL